MDSSTKLAALAPREDFPLLKERVYLNSAAIGLVPLPVQQSVIDFTREMGGMGDYGYFKNSRMFIETPHEEAARLLGCNTEDVFFTSSISEAMCSAAWAIMPKAGENVVCIDIDIPAATLPWLRIAEVTGATVRFTDAASDPKSLTSEKVIELIDSNTAVVCLSHVQWQTGCMIDIAKIARAAHSVGAVVLVDAMHTAGVMPLDVKALGADMLVHGSYKWLGSYAGVAAAYIDKALAERLRPALVGSNTPYMPPPFTGVDPTSLNYRPKAAAFEYASGAHTAKYSYGEAAKYIRSIGLENVFAHSEALADELIACLLALGADIITPIDKTRRAGVIMARFPGVDAMELYRALEERRVQLSCRMGGLRFSLGMFNDADDVHTAANVIEDTMRSLNKAGKPCKKHTEEE